MKIWLLLIIFLFLINGVSISLITITFGLFCFRFGIGANNLCWKLRIAITEMANPTVSLSPLFPSPSLYWHEQLQRHESFFCSWFPDKNLSPHWSSSSFPEMFSFVGFVFISGVFLGILAILAAEAAGLMYLLKRLNRKRDRMESNLGSDPSTKDFNPRESIDFCHNKQVIALNSPFQIRRGALFSEREKKVRLLKRILSFEN